jgi:hypothetical protein
MSPESGALPSSTRTKLFLPIISRNSFFPIAACFLFSRAPLC